jgi:hypothetical protein
MIPDPSTKEGRQEALRRAKKTKEFAKQMRELAKENPEKEPSGKFTQPNEVDLHRDRENHE